MSILLTILKIIGIILLVLLAVAIIFLVLLLFVLFCYRMQGSFSEGKPAGNAELRYLFPLLRVSFSYESDKKTGVIRLLGIKLFDFFSPPKQKKAKKNKNGSKKRQKEKKKTGSRQKTNEITESDAKDQHRQKTQENDRPAEQPEQINPETAAADSTENKAQEITDVKTDATDIDALRTDTEYTAEKQSLLQKIQLWICKIKEWAKKLQRTISGLYHKTISLRQKWESIKEVISYYAETLKRNETKSALRLAKNTLKKLWKSVGPRKGRLRVRFGTGDPGSCGEICAFLGMVYPFIGNYVMIEPEMEQKMFEGDFFFRGHLSVCMLLRAAWWILFDKDIKKLIAVIKKADKEAFDE